MQKQELLDIPISNLVPYGQNARMHGPAQINQLAASIREFGFTNPVLVDETNTILAGEGRVQAARNIGLEKVPCIVVHGLTEAQKAAYVIADNRLALNSEWDEVTLAEELVRLNEVGFDINVTGFIDADLSELLDGLKLDTEPSVILQQDIPTQPATASEPPQPVKRPITTPMYTPPPKDWSGMPEFEQQDLRPYKTVLLHFEDSRAIEHFNHCNATGSHSKCQPITEKTKYLWWPLRISITHKGLTYE